LLEIDEYINEQGLVVTPVPQDCTKCKLSELRVNIVNSYLPKDTEILIVNESPGEAEDMNPNLPFCGSAGRKLDDCLYHAGLQKYQYNLGFTNLVRCRPKDITGKKKNRIAKATEVNKCFDHLKWEIDNLPKLKVTVCLGALAAKQVVGTTGLKIDDLRGKVIHTEKYGAVIVTHHPGTLLKVRNILDRNRIHSDIVNDFNLAKEVALNVEAYQPAKKNYFITRTIEQVRWAAEQILNTSMFTFDTETSSFSPFDTLHEIADHDSTLICVSFGIAKHTAITIPLVGRDWRQIWTAEEKEEVYNTLREVFATPHIPKIAQNAKFDIQHLAHKQIYVYGMYADTMIMHYLLDENSAHDLKSLAIRYSDLGNYDKKLEEAKVRISKERGVKKKELRYSEIDEEILWTYANYDVDATWQLYEKFVGELVKDGVWDLFQNLYMPLIEELANIEYKGVLIDQDKLHEATVKYQGDIAALDDEIAKDVNVQLMLKRKIRAYKVARIEKWSNSPTLRKRGTKEDYANNGVEKIEFNIGSGTQLGELFIDLMGLKVLKRTKKGGASFDEGALNMYAKKVPIAAKIALRNHKEHFTNTFLIGIKNRIGEDGRLHTSFNVHIAVTGRLSSSNPNLQNIPNIYKNPEDANLIRSIFIPDEGHTMIHADYSQAEFRMWCQLSGDKVLEADLAAGLDIHTVVACEGYGITPEVAKTGGYRLNAKQVVFGNMYGRGLTSVSEQLGIPVKEAQHLQDILFKKYVVAADWLTSTQNTAARDKFVRGLFGQKRHFEGVINSHNKELRAKARRQSVNSPIQGSASQMTCYALVKAAKRLREEKIEGRIILQIHDAIMLTVKESDRDRAVVILRESMLDPHPYVTVPLNVDVDAGPSWERLEKYKNVA